MDHGVGDSPVTLVIKAPNQKYDDQTISCFLNWTVEKLKTHLSNVYPSKPSSKDQRLVYSGRLLLDHLQLRDVLRKQDEYHMVHLVCASHTPPGSPQPGSAVSSTGVSSSNSSRSEGLIGSPSPGTTSPAPEGLATSPDGSADGVRYRGQIPPYINNAAYVQGPEGNQFALHTGIPTHPLYTSMQLLWWQQMYARQYYMQYHAAAAANSQSTSHSEPTTADPAVPPQPTPANERPAQEHPANIQMNAQGGPVLNEDELNRDWLDWVYTVSRAGILLSIVYFYSSFSRFVMVMGAMLLLYLHQAGWFPFRPEMDVPNPGGEANQEEAELNNDIQEMERIMDDGLEEAEAESGSEGGEDPSVVPRPGFLSSLWSFITTFFTSLIPEGPPHAPN